MIKLKSTLSPIEMRRKYSTKKNPRLYQKTIAVIGIGRVGLPLAAFLAHKGNIVYGLGRDQAKIDQILRGKMPFIEPGVLSLLKKNLLSNFLPTTDYKYIAKCDYIILTLGTPVDENSNPVYDQINTSFSQAKNYLKRGQTLILRSTVSPQTTQYVKSLIEEKSQLKVGENFYLAFCPERISEGKALEELQTIPQIIGGTDKKSSQKAVELFEQLGVDTVVTDDTSAELAKLFTNMYRYINFAIANEFMVLADTYKKNIHEIANLVNKDYKRGGLQLPGMTAGPCLFKDGFFLIADLPFADLISTSWRVNETIPLFLVKKIKEETKLAGKKVVILGLAFKADIDDSRGSLSFKVRKAFLKERAKVVLHDPYVTYKDLEIEKDVYRAIEGADIIFIATNHKGYGSLRREKIIKLAKRNCLVCDIWNMHGMNRILYRLRDLKK